MTRPTAPLLRPLLTLSGLLCLAACGDPAPSPTAPKPAKAESVAHESELLKLTLAPEAVRRLGIATEKVGAGSAARVRATGGEIVVPSFGAGGVPTSSTSNLAQIGSLQAAADGEIARTRAQVSIARITYDRADALVREEAGSVRARDEAAAALATAQAAAGAAAAQRRLLGPSVRSMNNQDALWVRVPVFGTDVGAIARSRAAMVSPLGDSDGRPSRAARPVQAPPSANATAGTIDLFYALDNRDRHYRVGQRVSVALPLDGDEAGLSLPTAAIVRDINGGEWVYTRIAPNTFLRRRIETVSSADGRAILSRGLEPGAEVVTDGAAELFGTEFGAGK